MGPALSAEEMLAWNERTTACFRQLLEQHREALALECDIAKTKTVGELLQHIVAVEVRYAERLTGRPQTEYSQIPYDTVAEIYATHDRAMALLREALAKNDTDWSEELEFVTRTMGTMIATRSVVFFHALTHSVRHYAQLSTLLRQRGVALPVPLDYIFGHERRA